MPRLTITPLGFALDAAQQIAFSRNFGELEQNDFQPHYRDAAQPEILLVTNRITNGKPSETRNTGRNRQPDCRPARRRRL